MVQDAKVNEEKDREISLKVEARNNFDHYIYQVKKQFKDDIETVKEKLTEEEIAEFKKAIKRATKWYKDSSEVSDREEIERHHKKLEETLNPLLLKAFGNANVGGQQNQEDDDFDDL